MLKKTKFRNILAIPGGGVKSIISATYIKRLQEAGTLDLNSIYSFSGTSGGAILAAALAIGKTTDEVIELYKHLGKEVFTTKYYLPKFIGTAIFGAPYSNDRLIGALKEGLGKDVRLGDVKRNLVMMTWWLNGRSNGKLAASPLLVHTHACNFENEKILQDVPLYMLVAGSCAAPSYFDPVHIKTKSREYLLADGGLISNLSAVGNAALTISAFHGEKVHPDHIAALVLGNGTRIRYESPTNMGGWKTPKMVNRVLSSIVGANQTFSNELMNILFVDRFKNFDPVSPEWSLDDAHLINDMVWFAESQDLAELQTWIKAYFR